jgi:hypothetical protein
MARRREISASKVGGRFSGDIEASGGLSCLKALSISMHFTLETPLKLNA